MKKKECDNLIEKYPELYADPYPDNPRKYYMQLGGFECGDGWYDLLDKLSQKISDYIKKNPIEDFYVQQVKEKYGYLSYYYSGYNEDINEMINEAEEEACHTCEECGLKENIETKGRHWIQTLCSKCREEQ